MVGLKSIGPLLYSGDSLLAFCKCIVHTLDRASLLCSAIMQRGPRYLAQHRPNASQFLICSSAFSEIASVVCDSVKGGLCSGQEAHTRAPEGNSYQGIEGGCKAGKPEGSESEMRKEPLSFLL